MNLIVFSSSTPEAAFDEWWSEEHPELEADADECLEDSYSDVDLF